MAYTQYLIDAIETKTIRPEELVTYVGWARGDMAGIDYPGALEIGEALAATYSNMSREFRTMSARWVIALEGYNDESREQLFYFVDVIAGIYS